MNTAFDGYRYVLIMEFKIIEQYLRYMIFINDDSMIDS